MSFETPILFLTFTRLDTTIQVFDRIREQQPKYLFIASDGPRDGNPDDKDKIEQLRNHMITNIDWECNLKTLFRDKNLGCRNAAHSAINWFFEHVEKGIVLEDDCLPFPDFFRFCAKMLHHYELNEKVMTIGGTNFQGGIKRGDASYYFSNYPGIWGWASWARAWKKYDIDMKQLASFNKTNGISTVFNDKYQQSYWLKLLNNPQNLVGTWDYQWLFAVWVNGGISIIPNVNLITNIGFDAGGTHTLNEPFWYAEATKGDGQLNTLTYRHDMIVDKIADYAFYQRCYKISLYRRIKGKLLKISKSGIKTLTGKDKAKRY